MGRKLMKAPDQEQFAEINSAIGGNALGDIFAHRHPLTLADCAFLRRITLPAVALGSILLLYLTIHACADIETALAAASGV